MLDWVREAIRVLPADMSSIIKFNCLTGLRPAEAVESVRLHCSILGTFGSPVKLGTLDVKLGTWLIVKIGTYAFQQFIIYC
jgi:hypothetical protein